MWEHPAGWRAWEAAGADAWSRRAAIGSRLDAPAGKVLAALPPHQPDLCAEACQGLTILRRGRPGYPPALDGPGGPPLLYLEGAPPPPNLLGIVGTRRADEWARRAAGHYAASMGRLGLGTVSGLAAGVDGAAHEGSLRADAPSWAVMGTGHNDTFPRHHRDLRARMVAAGGGILSEFPPGVTGRPRNFPRRNRVVAGLCQLLLVVQAPKKRGALHTVRAALDLGREVAVVPGPPADPRWAGSAAMLQSGAPPCLDADSLATALGLEPAAPAPPPADPLAARLAEEGPLPVDSLAGEAGEAATLAHLANLELAGTVRRRPDGLWEVAV